MSTQVSKRKCRVIVNAVYSNGIPLVTDKEMVADSRLLETGIAGFRAVELRFIVPTRESEDLFEALQKGEIELLIQDIPPRI